MDHGETGDEGWGSGMRVLIFCPGKFLRYFKTIITDAPIFKIYVFPVPDLVLDYDEILQPFY